MEAAMFLVVTQTGQTKSEAKHLDQPLVAGCSLGYEPCLLHVSR